MKIQSEMAVKIKAAQLIASPAGHIVIDEFLPFEIAKALAVEFGDYESEHWHQYSNTIEEEKTSNIWNMVIKEISNYFQTIFSEKVTHAISEKFKIEVEADYGLHGGGQHIHSKMENLNPHLDYSLHPKLGAERRLNAIYYLTDQYEESDSGHFGLWGNSSDAAPGDLIKEYAPIFNRLVLFNISQNSWHGLSGTYDLGGNRFRKSLSIYYIANPRPSALKHTGALFAPREERKNNATVLEEKNSFKRRGTFECLYI